MKNEILIYGSIGTGTHEIRAESVLRQLQAADGDITIRICSAGGEIFEAITIYNMLASHPFKKTVHIEGMAVGAGSLIAMAGDEIVIQEDAQMMAMNPKIFTIADDDEQAATADSLDKIRETMTDIYLKKVKLTTRELRELMDEDRLLSASKSLRYGFATSIDSRAA